MKKTLFGAIVASAIGLITGLGAAIGRRIDEGLQRHMARNGLMLGAITLTESQATVHGRRYMARHLDDAASPAAAVFYPGFRPRRVMVKNLTDRIQWEWFEGNTAGHAEKTVAAGTRTADTASELVVVVTAGLKPSITLAAGVTLQNKQYEVIAES